MSISSISPRSDAKPSSRSGRKLRAISDEALTVRIPQMCAMLNIGPTKAAELIRSGTVESILLGRTRLVKVRSIKALIEDADEEAA
jgi:hypothetical protein